MEKLVPNSGLCLRRTPPLFREYENDVKVQPSQASPFVPTNDMIRKIEHHFNVKFENGFSTCIIGGYGAVTIVKDRDNDTKYAVKVVHAKFRDDEHRINIWYRRATREVYFSKLFSVHPNVGKLLDSLIYRENNTIPR